MFAHKPDGGSAVWRAKPGMGQARQLHKGMLSLLPALLTVLGKPRWEYPPSLAQEGLSQEQEREYFSGAIWEVFCRKLQPVVFLCLMI